MASSTGFRLAEATKASLDTVLASATTNPLSDLPQLVVLATSSASLLYGGASGLADPPDPAVPITRNSIFDLFSATKLITAICALQLVERSLLALDDDASRWVPELKGKKIFKGWSENDEMQGLSMFKNMMSIFDPPVLVSTSPPIYRAISFSTQRSDDTNHYLYGPGSAHDLVVIEKVSRILQIAKLAPWTSPAPPITSQPSLRVAKVRGKGLGLLTTKALSPGSTICRELPLVLYLERGVSVQLREADQLVRDAVEALSPASLAAFRALHNAVPTQHLDYGIRLTNGIGISGARSLPALVDLGGVFATLSRANHSCCPNSYFRFDEITLEGCVVAAAPIEQGHEVTVGYVDSLAPGDERRRILLEHYYFNCVCPSCSLDEEGKKRSDERRARIKEFRDTAHGSRATLDLKPRELVRYLEGILDDVEREGMEIYLERVLKAGLRASMAAGDGEQVERWAKRVSELTSGGGEAELG